MSCLRHAFSSCFIYLTSMLLQFQYFSSPSPFFYYFAVSLSLRKYRFSLFRLLSFPTCSRIPTLLPSTFSIFHYRYVSFFRFLFFPPLFYASLLSIFFLPFNIQLTFPHYPILPLRLRFLSLSYFFLFPFPCILHSS